jgi:hypothetical protein
MPRVNVLGKKKPVIGVIHLLPLPGAPREKALREVRKRAEADARNLAGVDGYILENFGDAPFSSGPVEPHIIAIMTDIARTLPRPLGINVLRNDASAALGIALAVNADFIRVNIHTGVMQTDQGVIEGQAHKTVRYRKAIGSRAKIFADVLVKHATGGGDPATVARETAYRGLADALLVTGAETSAPADAEELRVVKEAVPDRPVLVASGVTAENIRAFDQADGFIIGSHFKRGGNPENPVDPARVKRFLKAR